jgi:hypothetical protein
MYRTLPDNLDEDSDVPEQPSLSFSQDCTSPGPLDNSDLFKHGTTTLKLKLKELKDYVILPAAVWNYLTSWYGLADIKTTLQRYIYSDPLRTPNQFFLDLYPEKRRTKSPIRVKTFSY